MTTHAAKRGAPADSRGIRVLYFLAYPQRLAGANRSLMELVTNLPEKFAPVVVAAAEGPVLDAYREAGVPVHVCAPSGPLATFGKATLQTTALEKFWILARHLAPYTARLRRLFAEIEPDLIHTNDPRGTLLAGPAARTLGLPVVNHLRGEVPFGGVMARAYEALPHRFVTVSQSTATELSPKARQRAVAVYNGTRDVSDRGSAIPWLEALRREGVIVVTCFASVVPFKGHHHLLRAAAELERSGLGDRLAFVLVGDLDSDHPDYVNWVRSLRDGLGLRNTTFAGWQDDPFSFYRSCDITVLPSVSHESLDYGKGETEVRGNEGFPRTHLEAMSFGLPVVGTDIAGVSEQVVDGETGFVVPPGDASALAEAIARLAGDPELRGRMGEAGSQRVGDLFSTDAYVRGVVSVYDSLLAP